MTVLLALAAGAQGCNPFREQEPALAEGIAQFEASKFAEAEQKFAESLAQAPSPEAAFDKGAALYRQDKPREAAAEFERATTAEDPALRARAYLDLGNAQAKEQRYDDAIQSYRRSLALVPDDPDARYNLEWAAREQRKAAEQAAGGDGAPKPGGEEGDEPKPGEEQAKNDPGEQQPSDQAGPGDEGAPQPGDEPAEAGKDGEQGKPGEQQAQHDPAGPKPGDGAPEEAAPGEGAQPPPGDEPPSEGEASAGTAGGNAPEGQEKQPIAAARPLSQQEADEILDAMQASERNFQMWKFQAKGTRRQAVEKDW